MKRGKASGPNGYLWKLTKISKSKAGAPLNSSNLATVKKLMGYWDWNSMIWFLSPSLMILYGFVNILVQSPASFLCLSLISFSVLSGLTQVSPVWPAITGRAYSWLFFFFCLSWFSCSHTMRAEEKNTSMQWFIFISYLLALTTTLHLLT